MIAVVGWIAAATTAFHLATANLWGYHRDEFYYLACGRRLAWGFVDHPPITPFLYRVADVTVGPSKFGLRIVPAVLHGVTVVLIALLARELGGNPRAQLLAALGAALAPLLLTTGHFLGTVTVEIVIGSGLVLLVVKLANGADPRLWVAVGVVCGIGLLNKWTFALGIIGLAVGLLLLDRDVLMTPWLVAGVAVALLVVAPNVSWQARHGWAQLEFASALRDYAQTPITIPAQLFLLSAGAIVAIPGIRWLLSNQAGTQYQFLLVALGAALILVLATGGKPYYTAAILPAFVAVGAVALSETRGWLLPIAVLVLGVLSAPYATPVLPLGITRSMLAMNPELGEMLGWESFAQQIAALHGEHPDAGIVTANYSEAGSIELLAPTLPQPASGHNSYWYWGPPAGSPNEVIAITRDHAGLVRAFHRVVRVGTVHTPGGVRNMEDGTPVWLATGPRSSWPDLWPTFRHV